VYTYLSYKTLMVMHELFFNKTGQGKTSENMVHNCITIWSTKDKT